MGIDHSQCDRLTTCHCNLILQKWADRSTRVLIATKLPYFLRLNEDAKRMRNRWTGFQAEYSSMNAHDSWLVYLGKPLITITADIGRSGPSGVLDVQPIKH
jgi:hypothetical protein